MDRLLFVLLLLSVTLSTIRSQTLCTPNLHCSHICKPFQQDEAVSKQLPCIQLDVSSIRPADSTDTYGKCLIVTISRDKKKCNLLSFVKKSPKSLALQAVAEDGYPLGGFPQIIATGATNSDYAAMQTLCSHDTDEVKQFDAQDTTRIRHSCPTMYLKTTLSAPRNKYPESVELKPKLTFGTGYEGIQVVWCPIELIRGAYPDADKVSPEKTKLRFILEYAIEGTSSSKIEIARVTSGVFEFKLKPFGLDESNYGKKSCSPFPTSPFNQLDNPSISGYPDRDQDCCQVNKDYLPVGTPELPPPPKPVLCSKTTGRHCSHICKPFQQDQPFSGRSPCIQLGVMGITPQIMKEYKTFAKCLIVTISRDPAPACDPAKLKLEYTSFALQAVSGVDGFVYGGFHPLRTVKPQTDQNAMETHCSHITKKAKLYDTRDTIRSRKRCPRDNQYFDDPIAQEQDAYPQFIILRPKSQFIDGVYEGIQVVWCPADLEDFTLLSTLPPEEMKFMLEYTIEDGTGIVDIGRVLSGSVMYKYDEVTASNSNIRKKDCFQDPEATFNPKDNPSITGHPDKYSTCCHIHPNYLPDGTPALPDPVLPSPPTPPPPPPKPPTPPPGDPKPPPPPPAIPPTPPPPPPKPPTPPPGDPKPPPPPPAIPPTQPPPPPKPPTPPPPPALPPTPPPTPVKPPTQPPPPPKPPTPPPSPKSPTPPPKTEGPITAGPPTTTTTKKSGPEPETSKPKPEPSILTKFLKDCEDKKKTKKCVAGIYDKDVPPNNEFQIKKEPCTPGRSCDIVLAYGGKGLKEDNKQEDEVILELMGASAHWISVGFSQDDRKMGNDFVTECVSEPNTKNKLSPLVTLYNSWNYRNELEEKPYKKYQNKRITDPKFLRSKTVRLIKGVREVHERKIYLYCRFAIKKRFDYAFQAPGEGQKVVYDFSLHRNPVFLIFAVGQHKNTDDKFDTIEGNVNYHGSRRYFTNNRTTLGIKFYPSDAQKELLKAHGYIMYIIWIFFLPIANFVARYYKETLRKYSFCGNKLWLLVHVSFSGTSLILVFAGYLILSKAKEDWQLVGGVQGNWHLYAGLTCSSFTFTNMYAGIFMTGRDSNEKWHVTEFVHGLIGHIAFLAGFAALHNAETVLFSSVPCSSKYILWVWLVVYFSFHVVMSYHHCWIDWINENEARAWFCTVRAFFPAYDPKGLEDAPGVKIRLWILVAFVLFSAITLVSVCVNLAVTLDEKSCLSLEEVQSITKAAT